MNRVLHFSIWFALFLVTSCAHPPRYVGPVEGALAAQSVVITVNVGGAVNRAGKYDLSWPFTVEHAIQQAGGLDKFEQDQNRKVMVVRQGDGQKISVLRKDYTSFTLADGDGISIPRH
jgi:protein involved in polysaccharide export with SLBB domain